MAAGEVEYGGENDSQLISTGSDGPPWDVAWASCLAGVNPPQCTWPVKASWMRKG